MKIHQCRIISVIPRNWQKMGENLSLYRHVQHYEVNNWLRLVYLQLCRRRFLFRLLLNEIKCEFMICIRALKSVGGHKPLKKIFKSSINNHIPAWNFNFLSRDRFKVWLASKIGLKYELKSLLTDFYRRISTSKPIYTLSIISSPYF